MKTIMIPMLLALAAGWVVSGIASTGPTTRIAYPEGYRDWTHVKSSLMNTQHPSFASMGGFHHIYANARAMTGYRTGRFPDGAVIVFDWLQMTERDGMYIEGSRRQIDVMVRDSTRFDTTGGWGFERFAGDSAEIAAMPPRYQCFACHDSVKKDSLVLSTYRP